MKQKLTCINTKACQLVGFLCFALLLSACSSTPMTRALQQNSVALPPQVELQNTPFFPQQQYQCGPAALATVLNFQNQKTQPEELIDKVYIPEKQGSVPLEMIAATRSYDSLAYPLEASLEKLLQEVAAGHPVLVMQNLSFNWQPQWHYAVVVGYDVEEAVLVLRSGTQKRLIVPMKTFERTWRRANYWALVVLSADQIPATAQVPRYLKAAQQLETTGHTTSAIKAYQAAIRKWPDNGLPWLALGNSYYAQQAFNLSEQSFRQGLKNNQDNVELWNNLAYSLTAQGCEKQALETLLCAISQWPKDQNLRDSWHEINHRPVNGGDCKDILCPLQSQVSTK